PAFNQRPGILSDKCVAFRSAQWTDSCPFQICSVQASMPARRPSRRLSFLRCPWFFTLSRSAPIDQKSLFSRARLVCQCSADQSIPSRLRIEDTKDKSGNYGGVLKRQRLQSGGR